MRPVEPAAHEPAYPRENRDTIPTLSSALLPERNARLAVPFGSIARGHARTDPDVDVPVSPAC
jgi:predicted nucleotidyltransferase